MQFKMLSQLVIFISVIIPFTVAGQGSDTTDTVSATLLENSSMTILGSSTHHDWDVEAADFSVQFRVPGRWFDSDRFWAGEDIEELNVTVQVGRLDGGKNKMNRDLREALRYEEYPEIQFSWDKVIFSGTSDTGRTAEVLGSVTIAGEEREIQFNAILSFNEWSQIVAKGQVTLNMRDYNVDPPTALFGVIRTDEMIDLTFELYFEGDNSVGEID
jgi:hypothetical protein